MANLYQDPRSTVTKNLDTYPYISPSKYVGSLKGKVILITGAGRGIGRASAFAFAAAGANVACVSRTHSETLSLVQDIAQKGYPRAIAIAANVADADAPGRVLGEIQRELGFVDVLVNNAGISRISDMEHERNMGPAMEVVEVNVRGTLSFIHAVVPSMIENKRGVIINVTRIQLARAAGLMGGADKHPGRLRPCHDLPTLLFSLQRRQGSSYPRYSYNGPGVPASRHLLLRCAPMYE